MQQFLALKFTSSANFPISYLPSNGLKFKMELDDESEYEHDPSLLFLRLILNEFPECTFEDERTEFMASGFAAATMLRFV